MFSYTCSDIQKLIEKSTHQKIPKRTIRYWLRDVPRCNDPQEKVPEYHKVPVALTLFKYGFPQVISELIDIKNYNVYDDTDEETDNAEYKTNETENGTNKAKVNNLNEAATILGEHHVCIISPEESQLKKIGKKSRRKINWAIDILKSYGFVEKSDNPKQQN